MTRIEDVIRAELEAEPRPEATPFFTRRTVNLVRSRPRACPFARLGIPMLVVPPSVWLLTTSLPPLWVLVLMPLVFVLTMAAEPVRS